MGGLVPTTRTDATAARSSGERAAHSPTSSPATFRRACSVTSWHSSSSFPRSVTLDVTSTSALPSELPTPSAATSGETTAPTAPQPSAEPAEWPAPTRGVTRAVAVGRTIAVTRAVAVRRRSLRIRGWAIGPDERPSPKASARYRIHVTGHRIAGAIPSRTARHRTHSSRACSISTWHC